MVIERFEEINFIRSVGWPVATNNTDFFSVSRDNKAYNFRDFVDKDI